MNKRIPFVLGFLLLALSLWLQVTSIGSIAHFITRLQNIAYDTQLRANIFHVKKINETSVAIVDIDDKSLKYEGRWPWDRTKISKLVDNLRTAGAVVIAFDILFAEKEANIADEVLKEISDQHLLTQDIQSALTKITPFFDSDARLAESLKQIDVVLGISFLPTADIHGTLASALLRLRSNEEKNLGFIEALGVIGNIPTLNAVAKGTGFINVFPDNDGVIRREPLLIRYNNNLYPSLALEAVRLYLLSNIKLITAKYADQLRIEAIKIADRIIPTDEKGAAIIPFRGKSFTFPYYSATDVLNNKIPPNVFGGKIVFVGTSATGLGDLKATAVENVFPGVEIQATIADGILQRHLFAYRPAWAPGMELSLTCVIGILLLFIFPYLGPRLLTLFGIFIPLILIVSNHFLWKTTGLIISIFIPMMLSVTLAVVNMIYGYVFETRKRERLKEMFGQYVPQKHIDEMLTNSGNYGLYGEDREMTVLFADIRNFTTISEPLSASQLKEMLNAFFTPMTEVIFNHSGTIDKYVGDMIMAFWGAPLKDKHHAHHAISAALDMHEAVEKLKPIFAACGWAEINIGIGLNSGTMSVGDMGSKFRRNYTVLGDAVNLASRIEGLTKFYGVNLIVSEHTQTNQKSFVFRKLDRVKVKGKKNGIEIYEVLCWLKTLTPELEHELTLHHAALDFYFKQQWSKALTLFAELHESHPNTKLYSIYLQRIAAFQLLPPSENWDGIYSHASK